MNEPLKRRSLLGDNPVAPPVMPEEAITAVAARNGFANSKPASEAPVEGVSDVRRRREPTGRDHQFGVRLRLETRAEIYAEANGRNIPVAQVIEEAMAALKQQGRG